MRHQCDAAAFQFAASSAGSASSRSIPVIMEWWVEAGFAAKAMAFAPRSPYSALSMDWTFALIAAAWCHHPRRARAVR